MQRTNYYASPLRKDYNKKPLKILIDKKKQQPKKQQKSKAIAQYFLNFLNQLKPMVYNDGILIKSYQNDLEKYSLFIGKKFGFVLFNSCNNQICGKIYFVHPQGVIVSALIDGKGKINGCVIGYSKNKFVHFHHYRKGIREGEQMYYDCENQLLVTSIFRGGKLIKISNGVKGKIQTLLVEKNQSFLSRFLELKQKNIDLKQSQRLVKNMTIKIGDKQYVYYGEGQNQSNLQQKSFSHTYIPHGYGVMLADNQAYVGKFNSGILMGLGYIVFPNNSYYYGEVNNGRCMGYGTVYKNGKCYYQFQNQKISQDQFEEYLKISSKPTVNQKWIQSHKGTMLPQIFQFFQELVQNINIFYEQNNKDDEESNIQMKISSLLNIQIDSSSNPSKQKLTPKIGNFIDDSFEGKYQNNQSQRIENIQQIPQRKKKKNMEAKKQQIPKQIKNITTFNEPPRLNHHTPESTEREEYYVEEIGKGQEFVTTERKNNNLHHMKQMKVKNMFKNKQDKEVYEKNDNPIRIDFSKIKEMSSHQSQSVDDDFIFKK